jgi:hypothetical protein
MKDQFTNPKHVGCGTDSVIRGNFGVVETAKLSGNTKDRS